MLTPTAIEESYNLSPRIVILHGLKGHKWPETIFPCARDSRGNYVMVIKFFLQNIKTLVRFKRFFDFDQLLTSKLGSKLTSLRDRRFLSLLNQRVKNWKIKVIGLYPPNHYCIFLFIFYQKVIFLSVLKRNFSTE